MEEVIAEILEKEKESEQIIQDARKKVQEIQRDADNRVSKMVQEAKDQAAEIYSKRVASAEEEAKNKYDTEIESAKTMKNTLFEKKSEKLDLLIHDITDAVLSSNLIPD